MDMRLSLPCAIAAFLCVTTAVRADDWPQWLGPQRASIWSEKGIIDSFPKNGLKAKWRQPVGFGYAGPAVGKGRVFVADFVKQEGKITNNPGKRDVLIGMERVLCFDAKNGDLLWKHEDKRSYALSFPAGPRCTPTVDGNRVYALGAEGNLLCLNALNGDVVWQKDFKKEYGAKTPIWGFAAHPLVYGEMVYCIVGGKDSVAVAFDKHNGKEVWHKLSAAEQGYCPPTLIEHAGKFQLLIWHPEAINSLDPKTGDVHWSVALKPDYAMSITAPRKLGDLLFVSGYQHEALLLKLENGKPATVWTGKPKTAVYCDNSTPFLEDGVIFGVDGNAGALVAASLKDGKRLWQTRKPINDNPDNVLHGTAFLVKHQDRFVLFSETGDLIFAKLSPEKYEEISRCHILDPTNSAFGRKVVWSHPAFAEKCCFARNDEELVCVNLAAQ
jgi:outer membrane protein assembly factor BamB